MSAINTPDLYVRFQRAFSRELPSGRVASSAVSDWIARQARHRTVTTSELYRVATEAARYTQPQLPVRYWFYRIRYLLGLSPLTQRQQYDDWLAQQPPLHPLLGRRFSALRTAPLDPTRGGPGGPHYGGGNEYSVPSGQAGSFPRTGKARREPIRYGGYGERRFYPAHPFHGSYPGAAGGDADRDLHLALDFWVPPGTPVYAPLEGLVYGLAYDYAARDTTPTLVLYHVPQPGVHFYTLYGDLEEEEVTEWRIGQKVRAGRRLGRASHRTGYTERPSRLRFQVQLDMLGRRDRYFGAGYAREADLWLRFCPDPAGLLR